MASERITVAKLLLPMEAGLLCKVAKAVSDYVHEGLLGDDWDVDAIAGDPLTGNAGELHFVAYRRLPEDPSQDDGKKKRGR